jgi:serine/threonine-protein kinase
MTQAGVILGTAGYMSPEQAKGHVADKRSDIWSFGCVLYEMVTGRRAFHGEEVGDTLASVIKSDPDWSLLPSDLSPAVRALIEQCLVKDRRKRIGDIAVARFVLAQQTALTTPARTTTTVARSTARMRAALVLGALAAVALGAAVTWVMTRTAPSPPLQTRFSVEAVRPLTRNAFYRNIAISPDGTRLIYAGVGAGQRQQLFVRRLDQLDTQELRGIPEGNSPFFSPDGQAVGFFVGSELKKVPVDGGAVISLCRYSGTPRGATWGANDTIVFASNDPATGLFSVPAGGGDPQILTRPDTDKGEQDHLFPSMLPGDRAVVFTIARGGSIDDSHVAVLELDTGRTTTLLRGGSHAIYVDSGHLVYAAAGGLRAVRFDPDRLTISGDPLAVVEQVQTLGSGAAHFDVSRTGTLVFMPGNEDAVASAARPMVWVDRSGREQTINAPAHGYVLPRLSPDGKRVALDIRDQTEDIWIWDLERETLTKLTTSVSSNTWPIWTPDGTHILFTSARDGRGQNLFRQRADFTGVAERLSTSVGTQHATSFSPDGKALVVQTYGGNVVDLSLMSMETLLSGKPATGTIEPQPLIRTPAGEAGAEISPDGRWLAYYSNSSGRNEVYVRAFPNVESGGQWTISTTGGTRPAWSRNGRELFYLDGNGAMMAVPVQTTPTFSAGKPAKLFDANWWAVLTVRMYDVTADGQRFLAIKDLSSDSESATPQTFTVVVNWIEELKQKRP